MLVLERRPGSSVFIGENIEIQVRTIRHRKAVRLAIRAPQSVPVLRQELRRHGEEAGQDEGPAPAEMLDLSVVAIEDDQAHRQIIAETLQDLAVRQIATFASAEEAFAELAKVGPEHPAPDLILLDLQLPGMSGLDMLQQLRQPEALRSVPIVVLSSSDDDDHVSKCLDAGANAFVSKSVQFDTFTDSVARIIDFWGMARRKR